MPNNGRKVILFKDKKQDDEIAKKLNSEDFNLDKEAIDTIINNLSNKIDDSKNTILNEADTAVDNKLNIFYQNLIDELGVSTTTTETFYEMIHHEIKKYPKTLEIVNTNYIIKRFSLPDNKLMTLTVDSQIEGVITMKLFGFILDSVILTKTVLHTETDIDIKYS